MEENMVSIPLETYNELVRKAERIDAVERMVNRSAYNSVEDILIALNVRKEIESAKI